MRPHRVRVVGPIGRAIRRLLRERRWSMRRLREELGCAQSTVTEWCSGGSVPQWRWRAELVRVLGCREDELPLTGWADNQPWYGPPEDREVAEGRPIKAIGDAEVMRRLEALRAAGREAARLAS